MALKNLLLIALLTSLSNSLLGQGYYTNVSNMPMFPGGVDAYFEFIKKNLRYPQEAFRQQKEGRVEISMVVDTNGKISQATVIKGIGYGCNEEALRIIGLMPNWTPGSDKGKKVTVLLNIPIEFRIDAYYNRYFVNGVLIYRDPKVLPAWSGSKTIQEYLSEAYIAAGIDNKKYSFDLNIKIDTAGKVMEILYTKSEPADYSEIKTVFDWLSATFKKMSATLWNPAEVEGEKVNSTYFMHLDL